MFKLFKNATELIWIATAILAVAKLYQAFECDPMEVQVCLDRIDGLNLRGNASGLAANKKDLEVACRAFSKGMQCIDEFIKFCVTEEKRKRLEKDVMGPKKAMMNICGAGKTKSQNKPKFNDCYPILNKEIGNCSRSLYNVQRRRKFHSHDEMIKAHCCAQKKYVDCVHYKAKRLCDSKGSDEALKLAQTECPTAMLIDFYSSDSSKGDFSMSDILHLSDIPDSYNMSGLFESTRHNTDSESSASGFSLKLSESDPEVAEVFPEDDIRNETFDFELPDILEESEVIMNAAAPIASSRTQYISLNDQEQWNAEIMMEANKISRRLSLSSLSSNDRTDSRSTYILRFSSTQSSVEDDFVFDSPIKFTLTPQKTARLSSSDKENDPFRANRGPQPKTPRSSKKYNSPASVSSNDSVFSDKAIKTEELSELESKVAKIPEILVEVQSDVNEIKHESSPYCSSKKTLDDIENVCVTKPSKDKPIRKGTFNLDTDEEEALVSANIQIPLIQPLQIRRETYSKDSNDAQLFLELENLKRTRHTSGPSNLTPSAIEEEMIPVRPLIKSKSSIGFVKPLPLDRTIRSKIATSKVTQPTSFLRKPAIPPQTKQSLKTSRISTYGARPKPTPTATSINIKPTKPAATTTSVASKLKKTGPVKAQQRFSNLPKVETEIKPRSRMNTSLQLPSESTKRSIPSPMMNTRRSLTPQPSPVTIRTPSRISLVPTEFAIPLTPRRMSMLPSRSTPGRQIFATSSPLTPGLKRPQSLAGVPDGSKPAFSRLPSPMRRK